MEPNFKTIIEPFRIKMTEPIKRTTREQRRKLLNSVGLNTFLLKSEDVTIDLLTDSGTSAMSTEQWAGIMRGDESYAGSPSWYRFEKAVQDLTGLREVIPTHQGRAAERIVFQALTKPGQWVLSNMLFDTTRANAEAAGCQTMDLPCAELSNTSVAAPFKGNIDLNRLESELKTKEVAIVVMTVTNNSGGGQPASLENVKAAAALCKKHKIKFMIDSCRIGENSWFIKLREKGQAEKTPLEITREMYSVADITTMSAKKDALANIGGFIALNDAVEAQLCRNNLILTEGFPTYGGLAGRDLEAIALGLFEAHDEEYLRYRIRSTQYVGEGLTRCEIPIVQPPGGHAIYIDAKKLLPHIPLGQYPGQSLVAGIYEFAGIRCCEIGSVMFGRTDTAGKEIPHSQELVRLAIPRRVYTQSHMEYLIEAFDLFRREIPKLRGVRFTHQPKVLRHFTARFEFC
jgi:tryptophanase